MAFDKNLDKNLFSETAEFETGRITVGVFSYNDGTPKLQISRENRNMNSGEYSWAKLGRMTKQEVTAIMPMLEKSKKFLKDEKLEETD